jgi:hypothetical protein
MATSEANQELVGVFRWSAALIGSVVAGLLVFGAVTAAAAAPTILFVPYVDPGATPFLWFAIIGIAIGVVDGPSNDDVTDFLEDFLMEYKELTARERKAYLASIFFILMGAVSFEVAVLGLVASALITSPTSTLIAFLLAFWYPMVDAWLGQRTGYNIAAIGGTIALIILEGFALAYHISPKIPKLAATDLKSTIGP